MRVTNYNAGFRDVPGPDGATACEPHGSVSTCHIPALFCLGQLPKTALAQDHNLVHGQPNDLTVYTPPLDTLFSQQYCAVRGKKPHGDNLFVESPWR